jgi:hypothetical protein
MKNLSSGVGVGGVTPVDFRRDADGFACGGAGEAASPLRASTGAVKGSRQADEDALCLAHKRTPPIAPMPSMYAAVQAGMLHL